MKKLTITLSLFLFSMSGWALTIISDLDDTLKITNVQDIRDAARNAVLSKKAFLGFPELLNEMNSYSNGIKILTASPSFLKKRIESFFSHHQLDIQELFTRNIIRQRDSKSYKLNTLKKIFIDNPDETFILIGDDTQNDPSVYLEIKELYPNQVETIYIRGINNVDLDPSIVKFFTPFEIAVNERENSRMGVSEVLAIGKDLMLARDMDSLIPKFAYCPKKDKDFTSFNNIGINVIYKSLKLKITKFCKLRTNKNEALALSK